MRWDPNQYLAYTDERLRPFLELVGRIGAANPRHVVDLGCGPGNATALLLDRWPDALVVGIDNSEEMIDAARAIEVDGRLKFRVGDALNLHYEHPIDVLVSNATLQWVPGHLALLAGYVESLSAGGWIAFQVPGMHQSPSHALLYELASSSRWSDRLKPLVRTNSIETPDRYLERLTALGCHADVWEVTYLQVLHGHDAVLEWTKGSSLRPFVSALEGAELEEFVELYASALRDAYPETEHGTVFPFRRVFAVGHSLR